MEDDGFRRAILDAALAQVRRHGAAKTNVVDIARALGTSHTTLYRHFGSKAEMFEALVAESMRDERELAQRFVAADGRAADRLEAMIVALHTRQRALRAEDAEVHALHRRVIEGRPDLAAARAATLTNLVVALLESGVSRGEFKLGDVGAAAAVVRDAATPFIEAPLAEAADAGSAEHRARNVVRTLCAGFRTTVRFAG